MRLNRKLIISVGSIIGALLLIQIMAKVVVNFEGIEITSEIALSKKGYTAFLLPPLGMLRAYTHNTPVALRFTLQSIHIDFLKTVIDSIASKEELMALLSDDISFMLKLLSLKVFVVSTAGALLACAVLRLRRDEILIPLIIGLIIPVILLSSMFFTYDLRAFDTPVYTGALESAPWIIGLFNNGIEQLGQLRQHLRLLSANVSQVFAKIGDPQSIEIDRSTKVLHVSDIHNNPAAIDLIDHIVNNFNVDFIVDTGDITDYGTPFEDPLIRRIPELPVPYIFVAGNHDSPDTVKTLKETANVIVLDNTTTEIKGLKLLGFADPGSKTGYIKTPDESKLKGLKASIDETLAIERPDILAVHNSKISQNFEGKVPVILNGHNHAPSFSKKNDTAIINAGTTGAAGIRGFQTKNDVPYSAVLLYFNTNSVDSPPILKALDLIKISNLEKGFEIQRAYLDDKSGH